MKQTYPPPIDLSKTDGDRKQQLRAFALLNLGLVQSMVSGIFSAAEAIRLFYNADNCLNLLAAQSCHDNGLHNACANRAYYAMILNLKQQELIEKLVEDIRKHFPEVELIDVTPSPENPNDLWINVTRPKDEDRETELIEFSADKAMDILIDYGYHMLVMPDERPAQNGSQPIEALLAA